MITAMSAVKGSITMIWNFRCPECDIYYGLLKDSSFEVGDIGGNLSQNQLEKLPEATGESWFV